MAEKPPFRWNVKLARYLRANGKFVSWAEVRNALDDVLEKYRRDVVALVEQVRNGEITLVAWRTAMRRIIKDTHLFATAASRGGWKSMTFADFGRAGFIIRKEYGFLERLTERVSLGTQPMDGNFRQYSEMYAQAARETYHEEERLRRGEGGYRWERNVRHSHDSCAGCVAATQRGWQRIGTLPPIGARDCRRNCKCWFEYARNRPES